MMTALVLAGCGSSASKETETAAPAESSSTTTEESTEASEPAATDGDILAAIKERGKLIVGTASGYPPYEFVDIIPPRISP